jgi:hypothetical protein
MAAVCAQRLEGSARETNAVLWRKPKQPGDPRGGGIASNARLPGSPGSDGASPYPTWARAFKAGRSPKEA